MSMSIRVETIPTCPSAGHIYFQTPIQEEIDNAYQWIAAECRRRLTEVYGQWDTAAHYTCPACHHTEEAADTADGFDLPDKECPVCGQPMLRDGHNCPESLCWFSYHKHSPYRCPELQITKQVSAEAQRRLDERLSSCRSESYTYCAITISAPKQLSLLPALSEATQIPLCEIPLNDRRLWKAALNRILDIHFPEDSVADLQYDLSRITDFHTLFRLIGLRQGAFTVDRDFCKLTEEGYFLLRDELEQALVSRNVPSPAAAKLAYACQRADQESVPPDLRPIVEKSVYLWPKTSCINIFLLEYWGCGIRCTTQRNMKRCPRSLQMHKQSGGKNGIHIFQRKSVMS